MHSYLNKHKSSNLERREYFIKIDSIFHLYAYADWHSSYQGSLANDTLAVTLHLMTYFFLRKMSRVHMIKRQVTTRRHARNFGDTSNSANQDALHKGPQKKENYNNTPGILCAETPAHASRTHHCRRWRPGRRRSPPSKTRSSLLAVKLLCGPRIGSVANNGNTYSVACRPGMTPSFSGSQNC